MSEPWKENPAYVVRKMGGCGDLYRVKGPDGQTFGDYLSAEAAVHMALTANISFYAGVQWWRSDTRHESGIVSQIHPKGADEMTVDEFIARLQELRDVAGGGDTPVVINGKGEWEPACAECRFLKPKKHCSQKRWTGDFKPNDEAIEQVISVW